LVTAVLGGVIPACSVLLTKSVVDSLSAGRSGSVLTAAAGLAFVGLVSGVLPNLAAYLDSEQDRRLDVALQDQLYDAVNSFQGLSRFESPPFLDRLRMAAQATGSSLRPITSGTFGLGESIITLGTMTGALLVLSVPLTGVVLLAALPTLVASLAQARRSVMVTRDLTPAMRRQFFYSQLITDVNAAKEVRLLGLGDFLKRRLLGWLGKVNDGNRRLDRQQMLTQCSLSILGSAVAGAGLVWAVREAARGNLSVGDVTAVAGGIVAVQGALRSLVTGIAGAYEALLITGYHADVTELPDDLPAPKDALQPASRLREGVEFRDVWFRYSETGPWVLKGVNLVIPHGESVALVGMNGSGNRRDRGRGTARRPDPSPRPRRGRAPAGAAPAPCTDRPASSTGIVPAAAHSSEAAVNVAAPATNTRRPPARSVTRPASSRRPPNAAAYKEST
jgi:ATP-binding cassette subfamily B protein